MMIKAPKFWYGAETEADRLLPIALLPLASLYGWLVRQRQDMHYPVPLAKPVICVGNLVTGGAGKTPVVMALAELLKEKGFNPHLLTRGYGGAEEGPIQVAASRDTAADVGDEALLLVDKAPTWVSRNRPLGAQAAIDSGANMIVMDDGFQNPAIYKDFSFLVVDGYTGFGNGQVMPAGPLREPLSLGLPRADAIILIGEDKKNIVETIRKYADAPVFSAVLKPEAGNPDLFGKTVFAFAGIGRPQKFQDTLISAGAVLEGWAEFPDHFAYREEDLKELVAAAEAKNAPVITTAKDHVRLPPSLKSKVQKFSVQLAWQDAAEVFSCIEAVLQKRV